MHNRSVNARQPLRPLCCKTHRQHCAPSRTSGADRYRYPLPSVNNHTIQAAAVEVQRRTPEALQRTEEPYAGLLPYVEVKLKAISGCDRRPEARLLDQAAQAGTVAKRVMWLRKAADYLQEGSAHHAACRKGCSHCCHRIARGAPSIWVGRLRPGGKAAPIGWRGKRRQPAAGFSRPACPAAGCTA